MRDLCDVAYVMLVERQTERIRLEQKHALMILAGGGDATVPRLDDELDAFDLALVAEPVPVAAEDTERAELLDALGLRQR